MGVDDENARDEVLGRGGDVTPLCAREGEPALHDAPGNKKNTGNIIKVKIKTTKYFASFQ